MASARVTALRILAQRRLTEAQLWTRLERRGFEPEEVAAAVDSCKRDGYIDDRLFAELFVETSRKTLGDSRMVAKLVAKGVDREVAQRCVGAAEATQRERAAIALGTLQRRRPELSYPSAARAMERLGFPASLIYAVLREQIGSVPEFQTAGD